ncbi:MAG: hypothetical protein ACTSR8_20285 [Promethearchaeota archaeon]
MELVEKHEILDGTLDFVKWNNFKDNIGVEVYIEKSIIPELELKDELIIDAAIGEINGKRIGMLFIKRENPNTYG